MKNTYYHLTPINNSSSVLKYGLIDNRFDGIYLCKNYEDALNYMLKWYPDTTKFLSCAINLDKDIYTLNDQPDTYLYMGSVSPVDIIFSELEIVDETINIKLLPPVTKPTAVPSYVRKQIMKRALRVLTSNAGIQSFLSKDEERKVMKAIEKGELRKEFIKNNCKKV